MGRNSSCVSSSWDTGEVGTNQGVTFPSSSCSLLVDAKSCLYSSLLLTVGRNSSCVSSSWDTGVAGTGQELALPLSSCSLLLIPRVTDPSSLDEDTLSSPEPEGLPATELALSLSPNSPPLSRIKESFASDMESNDIECISLSSFARKGPTS